MSELKGYEPSPSEIKAGASITDSQREQTEACEYALRAGGMTDGEVSKTKPEQENFEETIKKIVENEVTFWKKMGVEVDEADIKEKIKAMPELVDFDHYVYVPQGIKMSEVFEKMKKVGQEASSHYSTVQMDEFITPRDNQKDSYAIAARFQPEPDADSLGDNAKSAEEWEKTDNTFMSPIEYFIIAMRYQTETNRYLDENTYTHCPGSRAPNGDVPNLYFHAFDGEVRIDGDASSSRRPCSGIRRVVASS